MTSSIDKTVDGEQRPANSTYKKLAVQWLNEHLCFVSSSVLADSFVLRNRQLLVAAIRCQKLYHKSHKPGEKQPAYGKGKSIACELLRSMRRYVLTADKAPNWLRL